MVFMPESNSPSQLPTILAGVGFFLAQGALFYAIFRFRKKVHPRAEYLLGKALVQARVVIAVLLIIVVTDLLVDGVKGYQPLMPHQRALLTSDELSEIVKYTKRQKTK